MSLLSLSTCLLMLPLTGGSIAATYFAIAGASADVVPVDAPTAATAGLGQEILAAPAVDDSGLFTPGMASEALPEQMPSASPDAQDLHTDVPATREITVWVHRSEWADAGPTAGSEPVRPCAGGFDGDWLPVRAVVRLDAGAGLPHGLETRRCTRPSQ